MKLFLLLILLVVPIANAFDCGRVIDQEQCGQVMQSNLSSTDKDVLVSTMIYASNYPEHKLIHDWNVGINVGAAPDNVSVQESGFIKQAWLRIFAVMPSILFNESIFVPPQSFVQTEYNYSVVYPAGTQPGDCLTEYNCVREQKDLRVYSNTDLVGTTRLTPLSLFENRTIKSSLDLTVVTDVYHYQWYTWCCVPGYWSCAQYCTECQLNNVERKTDALHLEDSKKVVYYNPSQEINFRIIDSYYNITKGLFSAENYTAFHLNFENSTLREHYYNYDLAWDYSPYYALTIQAHPYDYEEISNLFVVQNGSKYFFTIQNTNNCNIEVFDFFNNQTIPCNLTYEQNELLIKTDKLIYAPNETITVKIKPENKEVQITYANETYLAVNEINLTAQYSYDKITGTYDYKTIEKAIHVKNTNSWTLLITLISVFVLLILVFSLLKKYWNFI